MQHLRLSMIILLLALSGQLQAADPQAAFAATGDVLFELDIENASFKVRHDGYVDILFGPSLPDDAMQQAIEKLRAHPDIPGILAGRGGEDYCPAP